MSIKLSDPFTSETPPRTSARRRPSSRSVPSTSSLRGRPRQRRDATLALETQSMLVFAVAMLLGVGALVAPMPLVATILLMAVGVALVSRALAVLAADPSAARAVRPRELANWDGALAAALGAIAIAFVVGDAEAGTLVAVGGAVALAVLRLRTRYALLTAR